jgi:hypothetical protein
MYNDNMLKILKKILFIILLFVACINFVPAYAVDKPVTETSGADTRNPKYTTDKGIKEFTTCKIPKRSVKIWDLGKVNEFLPVIPAVCANDSDGDIRPLTIAIIPDLIIRVLGLLFSLAFWLVPLWIIVYGFFIIALPFDGGINTQSTVSVATIGKKAAEKAIELVAGIVLISISFTIVMTVLRLIGLDNGSVNTDLSSFFTL